jgi:hypothetical protein
MNITTVGTGYVNLVTGTCLDDLVEQFHYKPATTAKDTNPTVCGLVS